MTAKWYRTDETENAIDYLEVSAAFKADNRAHKWKWLTIALHGALYGSAVLAIRGTDPARVHQGKNVISLWKALERCQSDAYMLQYVGSRQLAISKNEMLSINKLSDTFRNNFEHFSPGLWSIEISVFPGIMSDVCRIIRFLLLESGNVRVTSSQRKRVVAALRQLSRH